MSYKLATSSWDQEELNAIQRVIKSERFSMGPEVLAFEKEFAAWHNIRFGVMVNKKETSHMLRILLMELYFVQKKFQI